MRILPTALKRYNVFTPRDPENKPVVFEVRFGLTLTALAVATSGLS
ncbi:MAG: hypothetical protein ACR2II_04025 [Chthoniobacterales bacterium]